MTSSNDTYDQVYAKYYDVLCGHKDYSAETKTLNTLIESLSVGRKARLIDIGCGTGCHAINLSLLRVNPISGFDISAAMISEARSKNSSVEFLTGNIEEICSKNFGFAFSLFNVINCLNTKDELIGLLDQVNRILKNGSYFFFECWHQEVILNNPPVAVERRFDDGDLTFARLAQPDISGIEKGKLQLKYQIEMIARDGARETFSTTHRLRLFSISEIRACLQKASFELVSARSALPKVAEIIENDRMISILAKAK